MLVERLRVSTMLAVVLYVKRAASGACSSFGGKTGIRTLGARKGTTVFETAPIDHSGIFPRVSGAKVGSFFEVCKFFGDFLLKNFVVGVVGTRRVL